MHGLQELDQDHNKLAELPAIVRSLTSLQVLRLSYQTSGLRVNEVLDLLVTAPRLQHLHVTQTGAFDLISQFLIGQAEVRLIAEGRKPEDVLHWCFGYDAQSGSEEAEYSDSGSEEDYSEELDWPPASSPVH
ncbi:hypothetical protein WJX72_012388 [[Myrmecia] bisecta]|uniref:Uncharacterized protein n=1 Tax=[Myrmecia] bisecta TaxID=41462 RepID=A0AAW1PA15_9CHLO